MPRRLGLEATSTRPLRESSCHRNEELPQAVTLRSEGEARVHGPKSNCIDAPANLLFGSEFMLAHVSRPPHNVGVCPKTHHSLSRSSATLIIRVVFAGAFFKTEICETPPSTHLQRSAKRKWMRISSCKN